MRKLLIFMTVMFISFPVQAGRILKDKQSGEYLAGWYISNDTPGTLLKNAVINGDFLSHQIEEIAITDEQWQTIRNEKVVMPKKEKEQIRKNKVNQFKVKLKQNFGFTDEELKLLFKE